MLPKGSLLPPPAPPPNMPVTPEKSPPVVPPPVLAPPPPAALAGTVPGTTGNLAPRLKRKGLHNYKGQVWSLTQLYTVDFSQPRISVKKRVFNKRTIKVWVSCSRRCPGTFAPSAAHLTVSLYLCSSGSKTRGESRAQDSPRA